MILTHGTVYLLISETKAKEIIRVKHIMRY